MPFCIYLPISGCVAERSLKQACLAGELVADFIVAALHIVGSCRVGLRSGFSPGSVVGVKLVVDRLSLERRELGDVVDGIGRETYALGLV